MKVMGIFYHDFIHDFPGNHGKAIRKMENEWEYHEKNDWRKIMDIYMNCNDTRPGQDVTLDKFGLPQNLKVETNLIEINVCFLSEKW